LATIFTAARHTGTELDGVNDVAIVQVVARFVVNMVEVHLLPAADPSSRSNPPR
jgi:hypothetical protein